MFIKLISIPQKSDRIKHTIFQISKPFLFLKVFQIFARNLSFNLSNKHLEIQSLARKYAEKYIKPDAAKLDAENRFPDKIHHLGELGLLSVCVSKRWDGSNLDTLALALVVEEISRACAGTGSIVSIHNCLYANLLNRLGTETQNEQFLRPFTKGSLGCFALSEPDAGSDVSNLSTSAVLDGNDYILNGTKSWVTSGREGRAVIVFATIDKTLQHKGISAFIVPMPCKGLHLGQKDDKLGIRAASSCNIVLDNVRVPTSNILGSIGDGFRIAMEQLDVARIGIAAQALGIGQAAMDLALDYSAQRRAFGKPINQLQATKLRIADMAIKLESARLLVYKAAVLCDDRGRSTKESSMAKLVASEASTFVTHSCIQILGGVGYVKDMAAERYYRDARVTEIYGGISDIQRLLIADLVIKENAK